VLVEQSIHLGSEQRVAVHSPLLTLAALLIHGGERFLRLLRCRAKPTGPRRSAVGCSRLS